MTSCQTCHNSPFSDESWTAAISYDAVQASSRDGCPSCGLLARASEMLPKELKAKSRHVELHFLWRPGSGYQFLSVRLEHGTSTASQIFDLYVTQGPSGVRLLLGANFYVSFVLGPSHHVVCLSSSDRLQALSRRGRVLGTGDTYHPMPTPRNACPWQSRGSQTVLRRILNVKRWSPTSCLTA